MPIVQKALSFAFKDTDNDTKDKKTINFESFAAEDLKSETGDKLLREL